VGQDAAEGAQARGDVLDLVARQQQLDDGGQRLRRSNLAQSIDGALPDLVVGEQRDQRLHGPGLTDLSQRVDRGEAQPEVGRDHLLQRLHRGGGPQLAQALDRRLDNVDVAVPEQPDEIGHHRRVPGLAQGGGDEHDHFRIGVLQALQQGGHASQPTFGQRRQRGVTPDDVVSGDHADQLAGVHVAGRLIDGPLPLREVRVTEPQ
jgi:hypothetical protein